MADYAELLTFLKKTIKGAEKSPVIAFGGSYGGMLAAWFRLKYPHICAGAIAASAPVAQFDAPCDAFGRIVTADYSSEGDFCSGTIRESWAVIDNITSTSKFWNHTGAKILYLSKNSHFESPIFQTIHNSKVPFFTKFTISKSSFFTKFAFSKSLFSQNSHFSNSKFLVIYG